MEPLETRCVFAAPTLALIPNVTVLAGAPLHIPMDGFDADGDALTFSATSINPSLTLYHNADNRSMKVSVTYTGDGTPADPSFAGDMLFELFDDRAQRPAGAIATLAQQGFYTNSKFHRVAKNDGQGNLFVIQGGISATGQAAAQFDDQLHNDLQHTGVGLLSMAKTATDDTNNSQFFVTAGSPRFLDFNHSVFGRLTEGDDIRAKIQNVPVGSGDAPVRDVVMTSVTVYMDTQNRVLTLSAPAGTTGTAEVTVTVNDGNGGEALRTFQVTFAADPQNGTPYLLDISPIQITTSSTVNIQLPASDVEGNGIKYFFNDPNDPTMDFTLDPNTGAGTLTASAGTQVGIKSVFVGVAATDSGPFDTQAIPIFVNPLAPTGVTLVTGSDTGASNSDGVTRLDNTVGKELQFQVSGVVSGYTVSVFAGTTLIGQAVASGTTVTVTTNGTAALAAGTHAITARQSKVNQPVNVGNDNRTVNLDSALTGALSIKVGSDWQNPANARDVDAEEGIEPLDALIIINELNSMGSHTLGPAPGVSVNYYDVDGNGVVEPVDALNIINYLNGLSNSSAQMNAAPVSSALSSHSVSAPSPVPALAAEPHSDSVGLAPAAPAFAIDPASASSQPATADVFKATSIGLTATRGSIADAAIVSFTASESSQAVLTSGDTGAVAESGDIDWAIMAIASKSVARRSSRAPAADRHGSEAELELPLDSLEPRAVCG